eukprot:scaffold3504_cov240-Pinguiococcus_pyrenoidosus.AAC.54
MQPARKTEMHECSALAQQESSSCSIKVGNAAARYHGNLFRGERLGTPVDLRGKRAQLFSLLTISQHVHVQIVLAIHVVAGTVRRRRRRDLGAQGIDFLQKSREVDARPSGARHLAVSDEERQHHVVAVLMR